MQDSLELSFSYSIKALSLANSENNLQQKGLALFNIAEVFSCQYRSDWVKYYYKLALDIFTEVEDNYNPSHALNNMGWISNSYVEFQEAIEYGGPFK